MVPISRLQMHVVPILATTLETILVKDVEALGSAGPLTVDSTAAQDGCDPLPHPTTTRRLARQGDASEIVQHQATVARCAVRHGICTVQYIVLDGRSGLVRYKY